MLNRKLSDRLHTRRFVVCHDAPGWNVREEQDGNVIREVHRRDWQRVELDVQLFEHTARALERDGWADRSP